MFLRSAIAFVLLVFHPGALTAAPTIPSWTKAGAKAWWAAHPDRESLVAGAEELHASLLATQDRYGVEKSLANEHFLKWTAHLLWLHSLPDASDPENVAAFRALGDPDTEIIERFAQSLTSYDDGVKAAGILCAIQRAQPKELAEFVNLGMAFALVFDQPFPEAWPHPNVTRAKLPIGDSEPARRFAFAVASRRGGEWLLDPRQLTVRELVFAVDTPIEFKELRYAQQVKLGTPGRLSQLYPVVPYDMARITAEKYQWPHPQYRLIDVGNKGGICVDQAYFVSETGKAQGVPTILFLGQGRSGGHAWVGILKARGVWDLEVARFEGENYPVGIAYDPQTWRRVTDAQMRFQIQEENRGLAARHGQMQLQWALLNPRAPFYREAVATARAAMPRSFEAWELEASCLAELPDTVPAAKEEFWKAWMANFRDEPDMRARGQRMLLAVLRDKGDETAVERLQKEVLAENRNARFDLGISMAADVVLEKTESGDWEGARKEFAEVVRRFQRNAGGHLFYNLLEPYVRRCLQEGHLEDAETAIKESEGTFKPEAGSILSTDLKKLSAEVKALAEG
jgi:hypothetical protein